MPFSQPPAQDTPFPGPSFMLPFGCFLCLSPMDRGLAGPPAVFLSFLLHSALFNLDGNLGSHHEWAGTGPDPPGMPSQLCCKWGPAVLEPRAKLPSMSSALSCLTHAAPHHKDAGRKCTWWTRQQARIPRVKDFLPGGECSLQQATEDSVVPLTRAVKTIFGSLLFL